MIERRVQDGITLLRMAHGKANALDLEFAGGLADAFDQALADSASAVVLTGTGAIFSAGVDLVRFLGDDPDYTLRFVDALDRLLDTVFGFPLPVVAAVNGHAIAGGCVLACACDHRVMARGQGTVGVPELAVGVPFPTVAFEVMRAVTPRHLLRSTVLGARTHGADAALARGLVDELVAEERLLEAALAQAKRLAAVPPETFRITKEQIRAPTRNRIRTARGDGSEDRIRSAWSSPEVRDAIRAYVRVTLGK